MNEAQIEALANAEAHLNNAGLTSFATLLESRNAIRAEADATGSKLVGLQFELGRAEARIAKLEASLTECVYRLKRIDAHLLRLLRAAGDDTPELGEITRARALLGAA